VAEPVSIQFAELQKQHISPLVLIEFGFVFHLYTAALDVTVPVQIILGGLFQLDGFGAASLPFEPVSPAQRSDLDHAQPFVTMITLDHFLAKAEQHFFQANVPEIVVVVEGGCEMVGVNRLSWRLVLEGDDALRFIRFFDWTWNWFRMVPVRGGR
jgi:hypothetical protein